MEKVRLAGGLSPQRAESLSKLMSAIEGADLAGIKRASSITAPLLEQIEISNRRYRDIIESAAGTATRAYERSEAEPMISFEVPRSPEVRALDELHGEVASVSATVGDMATAVGTMAVVARDAQSGLIRLEALTASAVDEAVKLRGALEKGQRAATIAAWVIGGLTLVLIVLTGVLVWLTLRLVPA